MRSQGWISSFYKVVLSVLVCGIAVAHSAAQEDQGLQGGDDLDKAFDKKIKATTLRDLDAVVKLCESALKKGLDEASTEQANQLAAAALVQHAQQLSTKIFGPNRPDRRWEFYRRESLRRLRKAVKYQPKLGEAYLMIARLNALAGGDRNEAQEAIDKAVELAGDDPEQLSSALYYRATLSSDKDQMVADLSQAIKINPDNIDAYRVRADYYFREGEHENAVKDLRVWLDSDPKNSQNYLVVAARLMTLPKDKFTQKLQDETLKLLNEAIEVDSDSVNPILALAQFHLLVEDFDMSLEALEKALDLAPEDTRALRIKLEILVDQNKLEDALEVANTLIEILPDGLQFVEQRSRILQRLGRFSLAIEDVKLLLKSGVSAGGEQFLRLQLADLYNADNQAKNALRAYNRVLNDVSESTWKERPVDARTLLMSIRIAALSGRGGLGLNTGEHKRAVGDYEEALEIGKALREARESSGVDEEDLPQPNTTVLNNLAWVLATSPKDDVRDGERSIKLATQAAELTEFKEAFILSTLASGYAEVGDFENAIKWIKKGIEENKRRAKEAKEEGDEAEIEDTERQRKSLQKEYESYQNKEPWRELQDVEKEKAEAEAAEKEVEKSKEKQDKDEQEDQDDKDDDSDESDDKDSNDNDKNKKQ